MLSAIKRRLINLVTKAYDPIITLGIGNTTVKLPLSHQLRNIVAQHPEYNFNLARIARYISEEQPDVKVIDIGANIGDTVAFIKSEVDVPILCIDGEEKYFSLLRENTARYNNVKICKTLVGAETGETTLELDVSKGTASLKQGKTVTTMRTLENILSEFTQFKNSKIIKSDTDGFDTIILRSAEDHLKKHHPVLFFEFDPHLIKKSNDDAFDFIKFLKNCGYFYFIFYTNIGDYLVSCSANDEDILTQLISYFSGRKLDLFADVCALSRSDEALFEKITREELQHFKKVRSF